MDILYFSRSLSFHWPEGLNGVLCLADVDAQTDLGWRSARRQEQFKDLHSDIGAHTLRDMWDGAFDRQVRRAPLFKPTPPVAQSLQDAYNTLSIPASRRYVHRSDLAPLFILPDPELWEQLSHEVENLSAEVRRYWLGLQLDQFAQFLEANSPALLRQHFEEFTNSWSVGSSKSIHVSIAWMTCDEPKIDSVGSKLFLSSTYYLQRPTQLIDSIVATLRQSLEDAE